jgi:signal transduction histidine kinase/DNA-binding response OmpR family regulator/streptogramin lyase
MHKEEKGNVWDLFPDRFGNLWVGTWRGHLFKIRLDQQAQFFTLPKSANGQIAPGKLAVGPTGKIWLTATDGQLYVFDPAANTFQRFPLPNPGEARTIDATMPVAIDQKGMIWIGSYQGLLAFNPANQQTQFYSIHRKDQSLRDDWINVLHRSNHTLWCGTSHGSIYSFDLNNKDFQAWHEEYTNLGVINDLQWFPNGVLFAATSRGIHKIVTTDPEQSTFFEAYRGSLDLQPGNGSTLWVTSYLNGLKQIDQEGNVLQSFQKGGDFSLNWITGMVKDSDGQYWLSGPEGMIRFSTLSNDFSSFLTLNQFSFPKSATTLGYCRSESGTIYLAGEQGVIAYDPKQIIANTTTPRSVIQQVIVNDSMAYSIAQNEPLRLSYAENDITITYAGLHFGHSDRTTYQYQLEGLQSHWVEVGKERTARFSNLAPGQYTFRLKAANGDGVWEKEGTTLAIQVLPPWWRTWWAYLLFVAIIAGITIWVYRFQLRRRLAIEEANRLKDLDQLKSRMYTNITHEFRTPLTVIQGMTEQARLFFQQSSAGDFDLAIRAIQRNARQLLKLINQMLDLSKLEAGRLSVQMIQDDAVAYLHYLAESFQSHAESKSVVLKITKHIDSLVMDFDPDKLMHIASNLLSNAIKFTPEGGQVTVEIGSAAIKDQAHLSFVVKDSGIGISEKDMPYIFDRFFQVDDSSTRESEGTGIGLSLTKELVDLLDGNIEVDSIEGVGTAFTVHLPVRKEAEQAMATAIIDIPVWEEEDTSSRTDTSDGLPSILIVEDNADVRHYIQLSLAGKYQTILASDGEEGIEKAKEHIPDLIISDVMMPKKDGFELCRTLKEFETTSHIPIVLLTARADEDSKIIGLEGGADAYLSKPFNQRELFVRLKKLIELRQRLQSFYSNASPVVENTSSAFPKEDAFIQKIQALLEERLEDEDFNVQHLTRDLGMSRSQVFKKLKALTGKSIVQYMREYRLQRARQLLQKTELSISEVAYQVGFRDPAYFSRAYSKAFGAAPSEMRK